MYDVLFSIVLRLILCLLCKCSGIKINAFKRLHDRRNAASEVFKFICEPLHCGLIHSDSAVLSVARYGNGASVNHVINIAVFELSVH